MKPHSIIHNKLDKAADMQHRINTPYTAGFYTITYLQLLDGYICTYAALNGSGLTVSVTKVSNISII